jgi:hypothetical protein
MDSLMITAKPHGRPGLASAGEPLEAEKASAILVKYYGDAARAEALLRAFLAEHHRDAPDARFWLDVYGLIAGSRRRRNRRVG